jgi:hypothetical protein
MKLQWAAVVLILAFGGSALQAQSNPHAGTPPCRTAAEQAAASALSAQQTLGQFKSKEMDTNVSAEISKQILAFKDELAAVADSVLPVRSETRQYPAFRTILPNFCKLTSRRIPELHWTRRRVLGITLQKLSAAV